MTDESEEQRRRDRVGSHTEDAFAKVVQELFSNPLFRKALTQGFSVREKAHSVQETAMEALNLPTAGDIDRLNRRLRSISQRLEGIEDGIDHLTRTFAEFSSKLSVDSLDNDRMTDMEKKLAALANEVIDLAMRLSKPSTDDNLTKPKPRPKPRKQ